MQLTDILPLEKWIELEEQVYKMSGLDKMFSISTVSGSRILKNGPTGFVLP